VGSAKDGQFVYTLMLNEAAGIEGDLVATRIYSKNGG